MAKKETEKKDRKIDLEKVVANVVVEPEVQEVTLSDLDVALAEEKEARKKLTTYKKALKKAAAKIEKSRARKLKAEQELIVLMEQYEATKVTEPVVEDQK